MSNGTSLLSQPAVHDHYQNSKARLLLFDWDGTLTPIVQNPEDAMPTAADIEVLKKISSDPENEFWIISGREPKFLDKHLGLIKSISLSAEHGAFVRRSHHFDWEETSDSADKMWQSTIMTIFEHFTSKTRGSWIERKNTAITWHYRNAAPEESVIHTEECKKRLEMVISGSLPNLEAINGKMCLEVRPRSVNKGAIVRRILEDYTQDQGQRTAPGFVLCVGDDVTDEDMFHAVRNSNLPADQAFTVSVGSPSKLTAASWYLPEPADVVALLYQLASITEDSQEEL
ncbi:MAG: hypothetical protein Q9201_004828 [Fulgogasparrea decipioides]